MDPLAMAGRALTGALPDLRETGEGRGSQRQELQTNLDTWLGGLYLPVALPSPSSDKPGLLIQLASLGPAFTGVGTEGSCLG